MMAIIFFHFSYCISLSIFFLIISSTVLTAPRGYYINCGSPSETYIDGVPWIPDEGFVDGGIMFKINTSGILPLLSSLRYFPNTKARKHCFVIQVSKGSKYIVRTTYFYGSFDGGKEPPVFDQIIDGFKWSAVDTSRNYAAGLASYYEIVVAAHEKTLSVCLARNADTASASSPFISGLEVVSLEDSMYNSTDFLEYALSTVARHRFGHESSIISYPDDPFNRYWQSFTDENPSVECHSNISSPNFWNIPPAAALMKALTTSRGKELRLDWPPYDLPDTTYYLALYFQDNRTPSPFSWRLFDIAINGKTFYKSLNVSTDGAMIYSSQWPLSGKTKIKLIPAPGSPVGPLINAGEVLQMIPIGKRTLAKDVIAMENVARSFTNPPSDWKGDPCLPKENSWTGVTCELDGDFSRVVILNLTNYGISGVLSDSIGNLTSITKIWLSGNKISGKIPQMDNLKELSSLCLANNDFTGSIPSSLAKLPKLKEILLQSNKLSGPVPEKLKNDSGINLQISSGNQLDL